MGGGKAAVLACVTTVAEVSCEMKSAVTATGRRASAARTEQSAQTKKIIEKS